MISRRRLYLPYNRPTMWKRDGPWWLSQSGSPGACMFLFAPWTKYVCLCSFGARGYGSIQTFSRLLPNAMGPDSRARCNNPGVESADEDLTPPKLDAATHCRPGITSGPSSPELVTCSIYLEHCLRVVQDPDDERELSANSTGGRKTKPTCPKSVHEQAFPASFAVYTTTAM